MSSAMIEMTTRSSTMVNPLAKCLFMAVISLLRRVGVALSERRTACGSR
jgi:hypothetical protein